MVGPLHERRPRGSAAHSPTTRERILLSARRLFAQHGYQGTSIRMVARDCGLTDPAVYYHFRTKADIFDELLVPPSYESLPPQPEVVTRETLATFLEERFLWWAVNSDFIRLLMREQMKGRPESIAYLRSSEQHYRDETREPAAAVLGDAGEVVVDLVFHMLSGFLWDVILSYGSETAGVVAQESFRVRVRGIIGAALDSGEKVHG
ncbi:MAG TPA: helix-turn-helix domain-containing protein [Tepidiformaceae bacterium]|nr:helix-turn-helix domain-containing protein [Tepidiformaceae bacterium]